MTNWTGPTSWLLLRTVVWLLALSGVPWLARAQAPPEMVARQVSPSAWYVQGLSAAGSSANQNFISNAGFVVTPAGVLVIDALGSPALATRLLAEIRKVTALPVTHVVVTHYHADHVYGLQVFQGLGARVVAHRSALTYLNSDAARQRLAVSRQDLAPWVDERTRVVQPDLLIDGPHALMLGGTRIQIKPLGPAHTPEDLAVYLPEDKVLYTGDLVFRGRLPFVGQADSRRWIGALDELLALGSTAMVPGHGALSTTARQDMQLTRDYLLHLRLVMSQAARNLEPFEQAYDAADWSRFESVPMFRIVNRMNAYNTYLLLERELE